MVRHVDDARLGRLALGDVDGCDKHGALTLVRQMAEEDRDVDGRAVRLAMLPGTAGVILRRVDAEMTELEAFVRVANVEQAHPQHLLAVVAVVLHRGVVDRQDAQVVETVDEHRDRVAGEK